jgi:small conductance mechanosensitive channel
MTTASWIEQIPVFTISFLIKLCVALAIMMITKMIISTITPVVHDLCKKNNLDHHSCHIINKVIRYVITLFGATIALQNLGVEMSMLIAAFGITGIVLSYGMKDIVANLIASILILGYKQIKIDDYIKIKDWEGKVVDINLRHTKVQSPNMIILIPNIVLYTETVAIIEQK